MFGARTTSEARHLLDMPNRHTYCRALSHSLEAAGSALVQLALYESSESFKSFKNREFFAPMSTHELNDAQGDSGGNPDPLRQELKAGTRPTGPDNPHVFKHAPPKPDGDPWEILLNPMLEADTVRCDAWKDEVQNLLIFAGLFSAVVTAFVIESYKFLQPDPNDAVVGLLFLIANSLNNTSPLPPFVDPSSITTPFSQSSSSVRINVFWFLSLILSLTTVLIGTISLQWLREHQSYPNLSPKEKIAILHMRSEALDAWYVPVIFSALPLLLQGALVLFLAGLIDFSIPLGLKLIIPVSLIVGLTLLFLGTTTVLPTFQALFFFFRHSYKQVPIPCPFKSPQSHALRILSGYLLRLISPIFPKSMCYLPKDFSNRRWWAHSLHLHPFFPFLYTIWKQTTWLTFDREWLSLRDACHQSILDNNLNHDLFEHREFWYGQKAFPLSDITQCIIKTVKGTSTTRYFEVFFAATVYCFQEISSFIWMDKESGLSQKARFNDYFEQLHGKPACSISKPLIHVGFDDSGQNEELITNLQVFNQDQIFHFLGLIHETHPSPQLSQYQLELWSHLISKVQTLSFFPIHTGSTSPIPTLLEEDLLDSIFYGYSYGSQAFAVVANMLSTIFKSAAGHYISQDQSLNSLCTHSQMARVFNWLEIRTCLYLDWAQLKISDTSNQQHIQDVDAQFISTFKFVISHLNNEISNLEQNSKDDTPSVLFYLASIFMWELLASETAQDALTDEDSSFGQGLGSFLEALLQYRTWTRTAGRKNATLETRFMNQKNSQTRDRFSEEWWDILFKNGRKIGLKAAEQVRAVIEESDPNSRLSLSSQDKQKMGVVAAIPNTSSLSSTSQGVVDNSPTSNEPAADSSLADHNEASHTDSQLASLTRTFSGQDDQDHDQDTAKQEAHSDSPITAGHTTAKNELLDPIPGPLTHSQTSRAIPNPPAIRPPDGDQTVTEATIQVTLPSPTRPPSHEVSMGPQDVTVNILNDEQGQIQSGGHHFAIEVGSPADSEQVEVADSGDGDPKDQPRLKDAIVRVGSPN